MGRRDIGTDDPRVRVRPGKGSRPRTKQRPDFSSALPGFVTEVDRGRFTVCTDTGTTVMAVKARALGRKGVLVGDRVGLVGDVSGAVDTLARIVTLQPRETVLRRSFDPNETGMSEKLIVANATQMMIVVAAANPVPRRGMIDRATVAALDAGVNPLLVVTKTDLDSGSQLAKDYRDLGMRVFLLNHNSYPALNPADSEFPRDCGALNTSDSGESGAAEGNSEVPSSDSLEELRESLSGEITVALGHSGVGKSSLINALVPGANRATGRVNAVTGKGRHTSSSAVALPVSQGWVIDTPGVRSFGVTHLDSQRLLLGFPELAEIACNCPRGCTHDSAAPDCQLDLYPQLGWRVKSFRNLLQEASSPPASK